MTDEKTAKLRKRFYMDVSVSPEGEAFNVLLDERTVKTPGKVPLALKTRELANGVAEEWNAQGEKINPLSMPLTQIACTAIDRVGPHRDETEVLVAKFAELDLVCYHAEAPIDLVKRQHDAWQPPLDWLASESGIKLTTTAALIAVPQPDESLTKFKELVASFDDHELAAFAVLAQAMGSVVLGLSVTRGFMTGEDAVAAAQIDETFQFELWGSDREAEQRLRDLRDEVFDAERYLTLHCSKISETF